MKMKDRWRQRKRDRVGEGERKRRTERERESREISGAFDKKKYHSVYPRHVMLDGLNRQDYNKINFDLNQNLNRNVVYSLDF